MKKFKKLVSLLLAACLLLGCLPLTASADAPGGDCSENGDGSVTWKIENDTLTISGNGDMKNYYPYFDSDEPGVEYVPWRHKYTFKKVVIGKGVTFVPYGIFLADMTVQSIEVEEGNAKYYSFDDCLYEKDGYYPAGNKTQPALGDMLIACPAAKEGSLTIADGAFGAVGASSYSCFEYITKLTELNLPSTWWAENLAGERDPSKRFIGLNWHQNVHHLPYGDSLAAINIAANHPDYKSVDGVVYTKDGKKLCAIPCGKTEITVADGAQGISEWSYAHECLTKLTIPASVT